MIRYIYLLLILLVFLPGKAQNTASKNVITHTLEAPQLEGTRKLFIYLPFNYKTTDKKYPVIYMHDAQNLFDRQTAYSNEWCVDETLDSLKAQTIIVGIAHGESNRIKELTPYPNTQYGGGGADAYLDFLVNTVKPYIDSNYRTKTNKDDTYIFGSSLGGLVSYYAFLKYPDVFGGAGVFSPSFWFNNSIYTITENTPEINGRIYFMAGEAESKNMVADLYKMEGLVRKKINSTGQLKCKTVPGGEHNELLWAQEFAEAYSWLVKEQ